MKKIIILLLTLVTFVTYTQTKSQAASDFRLTYIEKKTRVVEGVTHIRAVVDLTYNGETTPQVFNALMFQLTDLHLAVVDDYRPFEWGMQGLPGMVYNMQMENPHLTVIGGVNGDFYDINNTGQPNDTHIVDYEVIYRGKPNANSRKILGFKENGEIIYGTPTFGGQQILVLNSENEVKQRIKINKINQAPQTGEVAVFYDDYNQEISGSLPKIILTATDLKRDNYMDNNVKQFAKGEYKSTTLDEIPVNEKEIVLVGALFSDENLLSTGDRVVIQEEITNEFKDARHAIGANAHLVENGSVTNSVLGDIYRHPRIAFGVTSNNQVIMLSVDGRDIPNKRFGVKLSELGEIMKSLGAYRAWNLDGGGSGTMLLNDQGTTELSVLNQLSDGRIRSVSNGILILKGNQKPALVPIPYPDTRDTYQTPTNIYVNEQNQVFFDGDADGYIINLNGREIYAKNGDTINFKTGENVLTVSAFGSSSYRRSSESLPYYHNSHKESVNDILEFFKSMMQNNLNQE